MLKLLISICFIAIISNAESQSKEQIEIKLDSLFWRCDHNEICRLIGMISWESTILHNIPSIPPVEPVRFSRITTSSDYGYRVHPITQSVHRHSGIDLPLRTTNDTIYAPANGVVDTVGFAQKIGIYISLRHSYNYLTFFGHLAQLLCTPGQSVTIGQPIAIMGSTGASTGKHLHYTIKHNGQHIPPLPYCYLMLNLMMSIDSLKE